MASGPYVHKGVRKLSARHATHLKELLQRYSGDGPIRFASFEGAAAMLRSSVATLAVLYSGGSRQDSTVDRVEKALDSLP